jgi:hypothetical protein
MFCSNIKPVIGFISFIYVTKYFIAQWSCQMGLTYINLSVKEDFHDPAYRHVFRRKLYCILKFWGRKSSI